MAFIYSICFENSSLAYNAIFNMSCNGYLLRNNLQITYFTVYYFGGLVIYFYENLCLFFYFMLQIYNIYLICVSMGMKKWCTRAMNC